MDRELLELAAKAAWIELDWDVPPKSPPWRITGGGEDRGPAAQWNPLTDDGDALRLAVKLDMDIVYDFDRVMAVFENKNDTCITEYFYDLPQPTDRYAATRRAIVRAAAEIGRSKNT